MSRANPPWTFVFHLTGNDFKPRITFQVTSGRLILCATVTAGLLKHVMFREGNLGLTCNTTNCRVARKMGDSRAQCVVTGIKLAGGQFQCPCGR